MNIESIRELHDTAMMHVERATVLSFANVPAVRQAIENQGSPIEDAATELRQALDLELQAAKLAEELKDSETQALLMKSAAAIAFRSGQHQRALELAKSLLPYAPALIAAETESMIQTIEQARDNKFVRPSNQEQVQTPGRAINWQLVFTGITGVLVCALIVAAIMRGDWQHNESINLVVAVAVVLMVLINVVR